MQPSCLAKQLGMQHNSSMADLTPKLLDGHSPRSRVAKGGTLIVIGLFTFVLLVVPMISFAASKGVHFGELLQNPLLLLGTLALFFFLTILPVAFGCRAIYRSRQVKRLSALFPKEPWKYDYPWNEWGTRAYNLKDVRRSLLWIFFAAAILTPFHVLVFAGDGGDIGDVIMRVFFGLLIVVFDLGLVFGAGYALSQFLKYGNSDLRFRRFPFFLGETIDLEFSNTRGIHAATNVTLTLRFVQDRLVTEQTTKGEREVVKSYHLYADTLNAAGENRSGATWIPISFRLPEGDYQTRLLENPASYWELEVKAAVKGVDFNSTFLLPVYAKSATE
jgi:hypothetical protein